MNAVLEVIRFYENRLQFSCQGTEAYICSISPDPEVVEILFGTLERQAARYGKAVAEYCSFYSRRPEVIKAQERLQDDLDLWISKCESLSEKVEKLFSTSTEPETVEAAAADTPSTTDYQEEDEKIDEAAAAVDEPNCDEVVTVISEKIPVAAAAAGPATPDRGETEPPIEENPEPERAEGLQQQILPAESQEEDDLVGELESPSPTPETTPAPEESNHNHKKTTEVVFQNHIAKDDVRGTHPVKFEYRGYAPHQPNLVKVNIDSDLECQRKLSHKDLKKMTSGGLTPKKSSNEGVTPLQPCRVATNIRPPSAPPWGDFGTWNTKIAIPILGF